MTPARPAAGTRWAPLAGTALVIGALAVLNVVRHFLPSGGLWLSILAAVALLAFARRAGLSWEQLGLARHRLRAGGIWALGVIVVVGLAYLSGVLLPETRPAFLDSRYHEGTRQALVTAFLVIPVGTVLLEEVAFRSVLWGMLARHTTRWRVLLISSLLFGLWHVIPSLQLASANRGVSEIAPGRGASTTALVVVGTVAFTALGGVVAGELRRRSGSLLASAGMHWATNGLGVLFGLLAWRLVS